MITPLNEYQRLLRMDELIRQDNYPSVEKLISELEVDRRTIFRYKKTLVEDFNAPLEFDRTKGGYFYTIPDFSINDISLNQNESFALQLCQRFSTMLLSGSEIFQGFQKGIKSLMNRSTRSDNKTGKETADRIQFAFDYSNMTLPRQRRQKDFESLLFNSCKNGQMIKINYQFSDIKADGESNNIMEEIKAIPLMIVMHEMRWCMLVLTEDAFSNSQNSPDFSICPKVSKENLRVIVLNNILSIVPYKDGHAKPFFAGNIISTTGTSMTDTSYTTSDWQKSGLSFRFHLSFPEFSKNFRITLNANINHNGEYEFEEDDLWAGVEEE